MFAFVGTNVFFLMAAGAAFFLLAAGAGAGAFTFVGGFSRGGFRVQGSHAVPHCRELFAFLFYDVFPNELGVGNEAILEAFPRSVCFTPPAFV